MYPNAKPSEIVSLLGQIDPSSQSAGAATTAWVSAADFESFMATISTGVLGAAATVDAKIQQAVDSAGTSAKDVTGKAITQIVKASGDDKQAIINLRGGELDVANGFGFIQLSVTVGTAASLTQASLYGFTPRYADASASNKSSVAQIV